jgi:hypothetical protein
MDFIAQPLSGSTGTVGGSVDLNRAGFHDVRVEVRLPAMRGAPRPFSDLELRLDERVAVLTENWNAAGPGQVSARARGLVPSARLTRLTSPLRTLAAPLRLIEPALANLCVGLIEPDRIPRTRLGRREQRAASPVQEGSRCR